MRVTLNPHRGRGLTLGDAPYPSVDANAPAALLERCPAASSTPLVSAPGLAQIAGIAELWVKDERSRMNLGSFKALGAAYVIAHAAAQTRDPSPTSLRGQTYVTASAGNHGLSVAAGAKAFGAQAMIYLAQTVPESFATRLRDMGAEVVRAGENYEASMEAAQNAADEAGFTLLSDSSWPGYLDLPHRLMEGYLVLMAETIDAMERPPTHILLQAGVGGLACACAALARDRWGDGPRIVVVEPDAAPAIAASIDAGRVVTTQGPLSAMGRLDCKTPSLIALRGLARDADACATITEAEAQDVLPILVAADLATSASGGAGLAALFAGRDDPEMRLDGASRVLAILSEEPAE